MKMRSLMLDAGSILFWKDYSIMRKLWSKLTKKELPYNRYTIISQKTELLTTDKLNNMVIYEPIKKYNKLESSKLAVLTFKLGSSKDWDEVVTIINMIRPNTLVSGNSIDKCKYYSKINYNEKLDEYIY